MLFDLPLFTDIIVFSKVSYRLISDVIDNSGVLGRIFVSFAGSAAVSSSVDRLINDFVRIDIINHLEKDTLEANRRICSQIVMVG